MSLRYLLGIMLLFILVGPQQYPPQDVKTAAVLVEAKAAALLVEATNFTCKH
jgi:hypothetical protein